MKKLISGICLSTLLFAANPLKAFEGEQQIYADLLSGNNGVHIKVGAQSIFNKEIKNFELIDLAAKVLVLSEAGKITLDPDTKAWLAKAIGASKSTRYAKLLDSVIKNTRDSKLKKFAKKARKKLVNKADTSFDQDKVDLAQTATKIERKQQAYISIASAEKFKTVLVGDSIDTVLEKMGMPDDIGVEFGSRNLGWGLGTVSYSLLNLKFNKLGGFNFHFNKDAGSNWTVKRITTDRTFEGALASHPMMDNPSMMRAYIRGLVKRSNATELDRDIAAERLFNGLTDHDAIDALAWACKLLGLSGTPRYRTVLEHTIENSSSRKLKKYAKKALKKIGKGDVEQYKKGDIFQIASLKTETKLP